MRLDSEGRDVTDSPGLHDEADWILPEWPGPPAFRNPVPCGNDTWRVFHRDIPGKKIAEFCGENAEAAARMFCRLFGN